MHSEPQLRGAGVGGAAALLGTGLRGCGRGSEGRCGSRGSAAAPAVPDVSVQGRAGSFGPIWRAAVVLIVRGISGVRPKGELLTNSHAVNVLVGQQK